MQNNMRAHVIGDIKFDRMNIAFLMSKWPVDGGIETVTRTLANEFVRRGHFVMVLYTNQISQYNELLVDKRIVEKLIPSDSDYNGKRSLIYKYLENFNVDILINQCFPTWSAKIFEGIIDKIKIIECMHMALFFPSQYSRLKWNGYDLKMRLCGPIIYRYLEKRRRCEALEREFQYVNRFVFLSKSLVDEYIRFRGHRYEQGKLTFINNPLSKRILMTTEEFHNKENIVLCVARMSEIEKHISLMIKVWKEIEKDKRLDDWKFDVVGDGPSLNEYISLSSNLNLKRISFHGYQDPVPFYKRSKIFLMTSVAEGWGMTIVESQQSGVVPIVLDTFTSLKEIIIDGENGRIVPPRNKKKFQIVLKSTMINEEARKRMAKNAMNSCERYNVEHIVDKWQCLFEELL